MGNSCSACTPRRKRTCSAKTQQEQRTQDLVLKGTASDLGRKPGADVESQSVNVPGESPKLGALPRGLRLDGSGLTSLPPIYTSPLACFSCKAISRDWDHSGECFPETVWLRDTGKTLTPPAQLGLQHPTSELAGSRSCPVPHGGIKFQGFAGS